MAEVRSSGIREKLSGLTLGQPPPSCGSPQHSQPAAPAQDLVQKQRAEVLQVQEQERIRFPQLLHLLVELGCVFLWLPIFHPVNSTKNYFGGFFPLHSVQRSQNKTLLQTCSYNSIYHLGQANLPLKAKPRAGHSSGSVLSCYQEHHRKKARRGKHLIFSLHFRGVPWSLPHQGMSVPKIHMPPSGCQRIGSWVVQKTLVKIPDQAGSSPLGELNQKYFPGEGLALLSLGNARGALGSVRQTLSRERLCGSPTSQLCSTLIRRVLLHPSHTLPTSPGLTESKWDLE